MGLGSKSEIVKFCKGSFVTRDPPVEGNLELCRDGPAGGLGPLLQGHHDKALEPQVNLDALGHDGDPLDVPGAQLKNLKLTLKPCAQPSQEDCGYIPPN